MSQLPNRVRIESSHLVISSNQEVEITRKFIDQIIPSALVRSNSLSIDNPEFSGTLGKRWWKLTQNFDKKISIIWWRIIRDCYNEVRRFAHKLFILNDLFSVFDEFSVLFREPELVQLCLFFEFISDPDHTTDEETQIYQLNAQTFQKFAQQAGISEQKKNIAIGWLSRKGEINNNDMQLYIDIVNSVFAKDQFEYLQFLENIRLENHHFNEIEFYQKRSEVLKLILKKEIFGHKDFQKKFEEKAKINLSTELDRVNEYLKIQTSKQLSSKI
eukprot:c19934_g1_i2.p1 GENE.c19934_g1_i2~~c19934_g1_i2.p1  ORF type:complete len:272 (-),score=87.33 c19934_g1_i2:80-895(-)